MISAVMPYVLPAIGAAVIIGWLISGFRKRYESRSTLRERGENSERYRGPGRQGHSFFAMFWLGSGPAGSSGADAGGYDAGDGDGGGD